MRLTMPPRGRRLHQVLAMGAAPALVTGLALVSTSNTATASTVAPESTASVDRIGSQIVSHKVNSTSAASRTQGVAAYWTPERMANAIPAERLVQSSPASRTASTSAATDNMKPVTASEPALPAASGGKVRKSKTIGRVFFRQGGQDMVCSAAAVNSRRKNMVMTAGHCVHGGRGKTWSRKWVFVPGYGPKRNDVPHGLYPATRFGALKGWTRRSSFNADVAIALVRPGKGTNKKVVKKVGGYGAQFGKSKHRRMAAIGYSALGFKNPNKQRHCRRMTHKLRGTKQIEMRCKVLTPGASGGPWVKGKVAAGKGYINGVNSNVNRKRHPTVIRSTYFGRNVFRLYKAFRNTRR